MKHTERRDQLIQAATKLFSQKGFHGTTTKEIAAAAEVTEALIFRYFPTKENLYKTVIEEYVEVSRHPEWHQEIREKIAAKDDEGLFRKIIDIVIQVYRRDSVMQRLLVYAALEGYHQEADKACHFPKPLLQEILAYIEQRQEQGFLLGDDASVAFRAVFGIARSYAVSKYVYKLKELKLSDEEASKSFLSFAMQALIPGPKKRL